MVVVPITATDLGTVSINLENRMVQIVVAIRIGNVQKTSLLGTAPILRKVFEN